MNDLQVPSHEPGPVEGKVTDRAAVTTFVVATFVLPKLPIKSAGAPGGYIEVVVLERFK